MLEQAVEIALLPPEIRGGHGAVLLVLLADFTLPDDISHETLIRHLEAGVDELQHLGAKFLFKFRPEGAGRQGLLIALAQGDQRGVLLPQPFHFALIIGVGGIDGVAHGAQRHHGAVQLFLLLQGKKRFPRLGVGGGVVQFFNGVRIAGLHGLHIGPFIGHLAKINHFHKLFPF